MTKEKDEITIDSLIDKLSYLKNKDEIENIKKAYYFAKNCHEGQYRKSGEEQITHPLCVAVILTTIFADAETIVAALLHEVISKANCSREIIEQEFGRDVYNLVNGVNKLSKINFSTENEYLIDYYKKIIVGIAEDVRVIIIKLADRLHNMRTLWALPIEKQKNAARESLEIFAPIAHHLGINKIKSELEDLSFRYLKPDVFYDIAEKLNNTKLERDKTVQNMMNEVTNLLADHNIVHEIKGRSKSIYSIYNKLNKGKKFSDIYDLLAIRILVNTEQECYLALGLIHSKFKPLSNRFKDYIAMPKPNMYQSLHTTVFGFDGYLFEIQIRTYDMNEVAENGVAAHWAYKENQDAKATMQSTTEQKLQFFKAIMELNNEKMSNEEFVHSVKDEVLNNNIYVYSPKGDVFELPKGATPIDFAYRIHTKVGETMVGAIVNNSIVPLDYELKNNDIVKINVNKSSTPSKEWLNIAKCTQTKNKIKNYFSKSERELYIDKGKDLLEKELRRRKITYNDFYKEENIKKLFSELKLNSLDEIYLSVGNSKNPVGSVINIIYKEEQLPKPKIVKIDKKNIDADIIVSGIDNIKVNLANCCNPVYGDNIVGYITKSNGISIHRINCHNIETLNNRIVKTNWNDNFKENRRYISYIVLYSNNSSNNIAEIIQKVSMNNISVSNVNVNSKIDEIVYELGIYVRNVEQLEKLIIELGKLSYIYKIERLVR